LVEEAAGHNGIVYIRANRGGTPVIYDNNETFPIGGSKVLRKSDKDKAALVGAGMTLHEALSAYEELKKEGIAVRVIDLYSVKPVDEKTLREAAQNTRFIVTVEGHYLVGGIGDAVKSVLTGLWTPVYSLAVSNKPKSGKPAELLDYEGISGKAIVREIKERLK